jgi:RNA-directed DNA polymerase
MLDHIPADKDVLRKWQKAGFMENRTLFPTEAGTPQGGIISPTLANLTLDGLERLLKATFDRKAARWKAENPKVNFVRYADDFIITGSSKELLEDEVKPLVDPCALLPRLRLRGAYQRLEPDDGKLSRPVLRGGSGSNATSLPGGGGT